MPFFSVIIPLYNKEHFIENTLRSVVAQTFTDFEVIVVNDGSTDKSAEKASAFTDSRIRIVSKPNEGVSAARNTGISLATADFVTFLDADDYWYPEFLQAMRHNITAFPGQKVFSAAIEIETSKTVFPAQYSVPDGPENQVVNYFDASEKESIIWTSCAVFHRDTFNNTGFFDLDIPSGQDIDLWIRIGLLYEIVFCRKILARYIYDRNSLSKNTAYTRIKLDFNKFIQQEKSNKKLKKYLDLNRFSLAIKSKINRDDAAFNGFRNAIDVKNLSLKKKILLAMPAFMLKMLIRLREMMVGMGLAQSVFK